MTGGPAKWGVCTKKGRRLLKEQREKKKKDQGTQGGGEAKRVSQEERGGSIEKNLDKAPLNDPKHRTYRGGEKTTKR